VEMWVGGWPQQCYHGCDGDGCILEHGVKKLGMSVLLNERVTFLCVAQNGTQAACVGIVWGTSAATEWDHFRFYFQGMNRSVIRDVPQCKVAQQHIIDSINKEMDDIERRTRKRYNGIDIVRASPEYTTSLCFPRSQRPPSPDPEDMTTSKRRWERQMRDWRDALKALNQ
jgi:hypothetical protein